jgi:hypothetical protein
MGFAIFFAPVIRNKEERCKVEEFQLAGTYAPFVSA